MLMGAHRRAIHADLPDHVSHGVARRLSVLQQPVPGAIAPPAHQSVDAGLPRAIAVRQITPGGTGTAFPEDAIDHLPMIGSLVAPLAILGQERREHRPRRIGQRASTRHRATVPCR
jgi:hypothetical protein